MCTEMLKECVARTLADWTLYIFVLAVAIRCACAQFIFYACGPWVGESVEIFFFPYVGQRSVGFCPYNLYNSNEQIN